MTALQTLIEIAEHGENESARVTAANALLDRGWGKAAVPVVRAEAPAAITIHFGTELRAPNGADGGAAHTIEATAPRLLPVISHDSTTED